MSLLTGASWSDVVTVWVFLATSLLAWIGWRLHHTAAPPGGALPSSTSCPRSIYSHRSTWVDLQLNIINQLFPPISLEVTAFASGLIASGTSHALFWATRAQPGFRVVL